MVLNQQNVLFFSRSTQHGGTEKVILQLCETFRPLVNNIVVVSANGFAVDKLKQLGIKHYVIPDIEDKSPSTLISVSKIIKRIVEEEQITVIHTHHRMAAFYVRILGLHKYCRFVNTSHNTFTNKKVLTRYAFSKANLIACGEMVKKNLVDEYRLNNVDVIHNSVNPFDGKIVVDDILQKDREAGLFLIGNIGRLSEQKGMEYYIKAIPNVVKKYQNVRFYIIGSGEDEEKLQVMSEGLPITFMGYRTDIQNLMAQLDLIVLSSLWEGFPLTPIEAFSVGKTIIATGVDGTIEIVNNEKNGIIIPAKDSDSISRSICRLIENNYELRALENNAFETYEKFFSFDAFKNKYIHYYMNL